MGCNDPAEKSAEDGTKSRTKLLERLRTKQRAQRYQRCRGTPAAAVTAAAEAEAKLLSVAADDAATLQLLHAAVKDPGNVQKLLRTPAPVPLETVHDGVPSDSEEEAPPDPRV